MQEDPNQNPSLPSVSQVDQPVKQEVSQETQQQSSRHQITYAGFWVRLAAFIVDSLVVGVPAFLVAYLIAFAIGIKDRNDVEMIAVVLVIPLVIFFVTKYGATPGKKYYGLKIVRADGSYPSVGKALMREILGKIISGLFLNLGYIWIGVSKEKQGWHDKIAGTHVVLTRPIGGFQKAVVFFGLFSIPLLGILAAAVLVAINPMQRQGQSKDAARKNDIAMISVALESFHAENSNRYPSTLDQLVTSGDLKQPVLDPSGGSYSYSINADGSQAAVYAYLQNGTLGKNAVWCFTSSSGKAIEVASAADCQP